MKDEQRQEIARRIKRAGRIEFLAQDENKDRLRLRTEENIKTASL